MGENKKVWDIFEHKIIDMPPKMETFLNDIIAVYKKHGLSLGHEDSHGCFLVAEFCQDNVDWLLEAFKCYSEVES
jgi:hypothetical protein